MSHCGRPVEHIQSYEQWRALSASPKKAEGPGSRGKGLSNSILKIAMLGFLTEFNLSSLFSGKYLLKIFFVSFKKSLLHVNVYYVQWLYHENRV